MGPPSDSCGRRDKRCRADQTGVAAERGRHHPQAADEVQARVAGQRRVQRVEQRPAGLGHSAADNDQVQVAHRRRPRRSSRPARWRRDETPAKPPDHRRRPPRPTRQRRRPAAPPTRWPAPIASSMARRRRSPHSRGRRKSTAVRRARRRRDRRGRRCRSARDTAPRRAPARRPPRWRPPCRAGSRRRARRRASARRAPCTRRHRPAAPARRAPRRRPGPAAESRARRAMLIGLMVPVVQVDGPGRGDADRADGTSGGLHRVGDHLLGRHPRPVLRLGPSGWAEWRGAPVAPVASTRPAAILVPPMSRVRVSIGFQCRWVLSGWRGSPGCSYPGASRTSSARRWSSHTRKARRRAAPADGRR